jgi:PTH1 family peptidyl-tRNA hydrolase
MKSIILGLGNIGLEYASTRHNIGFEVVREVAVEIGGKPQEAEEYYEWALAETEGKRIILAMPTTYMNHSGLAAEAILSREGAKISDLLVVSDDFNLPLGKIRLRDSGSDGGQKGLLSIAETLETEEFARLRVGIGSPAENTDATDFVLGRFTDAERKIAEKAVATASEAVIFAFHHSFDEVMAQFNNSPALSDDG